MYWVTGILGFALAIAPFLFGYGDNVVALWTSILLGLVVMVVSFVEGVMEDKEKWEYWVAGLTGLIVVISPFILGFGNVAEATLTSISIGTVLALVAGGRLMYRQGTDV